jgi:hypothetical protein
MRRVIAATSNFADVGDITTLANRVTIGPQAGPQAPGTA